jgi:D-aminoacyl-tRNA deacylase
MSYSIIIGKDPAAQNIKKFLDKFQVPYFESDKKSIFCDNIGDEVDGDILIFPTTHTSSSGKQCLTVHPIGNWSEETKVGGNPRELGRVSASLMKELFLELKKEFEGEVVMEATHHGPVLKKPCCFIEIGSGPESWKVEEYGEIIAKVLKQVTQREVKLYETVVVLGGGHYGQRVNQIMEQSSFAVGHHCPKHSLVHFDEEMLEQVLSKHVETVSCLALDWKGMGSEKARIVAMLEEKKVIFKKAKSLLTQ